MIFNVTPMVSPNKIDCAPTCLAMLLSYYGETVTARDLYEECNLTISGCTGADIMRAGRAHGLDMKGYRLDAADVYKSDRPGIIHWQHRHFVCTAAWTRTAACSSSIPTAANSM